MAESTIIRNESKSGTNFGYKPGTPAVEHVGVPQRTEADHRMELEKNLEASVASESRSKGGSAGDIHRSVNQPDTALEPSSSDPTSNRNSSDIPVGKSEEIIAINYETLKVDLEKIRSDVVKMATDFAGSKQNIVKYFADDVIKQGQSLLESAKSRSESLAKSASETSKQAAKKMEGKIQERPFVSIVLSFLIGLILAKILNRN